MPDKTVKEVYIETEKNLSSRPATGNEYTYIKTVLDSGNFSSLMGGKMTPLFEAGFSELTGAKTSVAMNTCMSALHSAVIAVGAGAGSEVICDSVYIFGAMAALYNNAIPVFVDINPTTHDLDPGKIEAAITPRTKALIVTHAWGLPAEMDRIVAICKKHDIAVIEDCAEAILARYKGRCTGTWGDVGCFSFQASKQLSLGDGGMATAQDEEMHKHLANFAGAPTFLSIAYSLDYNYRMNEMTAAVGLARLETLPQEIERLRKNAAILDEAVADCDWITLQRGPEGAEHSFYYWAANFIDTDDGPALDEFTHAIEQADAPTLSVGYTGMAAYQQPLIRERRAPAFTDARNKDCVMRYEDGTCPVAEKTVPRIILGYTIAPEEIIRQDAATLHDIIRTLS